MYGYFKYCRWCGNRYKAKKASEKPGFCTNVCKQAHYRAYKKYVTHKRDRNSNEVVAGRMSNAKKPKKKR